MAPNTQPTLIARLPRHYLYSDGTQVPVVGGGNGEGDPTLSELLARAADVSALTDAELQELDSAIVAAAEAEGANLADLPAAEQDQLLANLEAAAAATQTIRAEAEGREQAAADRAARAEAALALVHGTDPAAEADPEGEPAEGAEPAEATTEVIPEATTAEPEPETPQQIAAAAAPAPVRRPITRVAARRPAATAPRPQPYSTGGSDEGLAAMGLTAAANAPGVTAGTPITNYGQLATAMLAAYNNLRTSKGPNGRVPVFTAGRGYEQYPEQFRLGDSPVQNTQRIQAAQRTAQLNRGVQASVDPRRQPANGVQAAGGICAPAEVRYDLPIIRPNDSRPVRDGYMTRFGADRGAVQTLPIPRLSDVGGAVGVWTHTVDEAPGAAVKSCLDVTCPADLPESVVDALYMCLRYGNFRARYFPEQIEAWMNLAGAAHARFAERRLIADIAAGSTGPITVSALLGATRDILGALDRALAVWINVHRTDEGLTLQLGLPLWVRNMIRTDIARQLPVGTLDETLALADAQIDRWFAIRGIEPVWFREGQAGQDFTAQGAGALQAYPGSIRGYLAPAGSWLFVDGGELNLGLMRDTTTTETNDVQFFMETFEASHFHGVDSWVIDITTGPYGSVSATQDINPTAAVGA